MPVQPYSDIGGACGNQQELCPRGESRQAKFMHKLRHRVIGASKPSELKR